MAGVIADARRSNPNAVEAPLKVTVAGAAQVVDGVPLERGLG